MYGTAARPSKTILCGADSQVGDTITIEIPQRRQQKCRIHYHSGRISFRPCRLHLLVSLHRAVGIQEHDVYCAAVEPAGTIVFCSDGHVGHSVAIQSPSDAIQFTPDRTRAPFCAAGNLDGFRIGQATGGLGNRGSIPSTSPLLAAPVALEAAASVLKRNRAYVVPVKPLGTAGNKSVLMALLLPLGTATDARSVALSNKPSAL